KNRRDQLSDCHACEIDSDVEYFFFLGDDQQGVAKAAPILQGRYSCSEVPQLTYAQLLLQMLRLDRGAEEIKHRIKGCRMISGYAVEFMPQLSLHLQFLVLTDNYPKAVKLFEKHLILAMETACLAWRFDFYLAAKLLLERLADTGRQGLKLRLPENFPVASESGEYSLARLTDWFNQQLADMAGRFDARNGNDYCKRRILDLPKVKALATPIPLPTRPEGDLSGGNRYER